MSDVVLFSRINALRRTWSAFLFGAWIPSAEGWGKVNVDMACKDGMAAAALVVRNNDGNLAWQRVSNNEMLDLTSTDLLTTSGSFLGP